MEQKTKIAFNVLAIISILIFCFAITPVTLQNDTYYTIKIGEHVMENGIDMQDPFSWHEDLAYTYPHWLYDVGTYLIYNVAGMEGIYIATVILSCILGLSVYITNCKLIKNDLMSFVLTIGVMCVIKDFIAARSQLPIFILFVLAIYFIESFLESKKKRYAIGLIIIPIIIANIQTASFPFYFVIYLPYIAEYIFAVLREINLYNKKVKQLQKKKIKFIKNDASSEDIGRIDLLIEENRIKAEKFTKKQKEIEENPMKIRIKKNSNMKYIIIILLICTLTGLLTPLGTTPYTYLYDAMRGNTSDNINEHLPMTLINNQYALCVITIFLIILIFPGSKIRLRDLFMLIGLTILMLMSRRQFSMFAIINVFILNKLLCDLLDKYDPTGTEKFTKKMTTIIGKIITILIILLFSWLVYKDKIDDEIIDSSSYPVEAAEYIKENIDLSTMRLYNEYNYGSYLLFQDIPVFIDSRAELYTKEFSGKDYDIFNDFLNISGINVYYETKFEQYDITHVIVYSNSKLNMLLSRDENYVKLHSDGNFIVYERITNKY